MIYTGTSAITYLASEIKKEDPAASSHWKKYHTGFDFGKEGFTGIQGFGNLEVPYTGSEKIMHRLLQNKFRKLGRSFQEFKKLDGVATTINQKQNKAYNLNSLRQTITLAFLKKHIPGRLTGAGTTWVIGDGFAFMSSLLLASDSAGCVILVNLTKTLLVDLWYLKLWMGEEKFERSVDLITNKADVQVILEQHKNSHMPGRIIAIQASDHEVLNSCPADVVINIASMQEMDPSVIAEYFSHIRTAAADKPVSFYCCNREEKKLPDGTMTRLAEYPWKKDDLIIVDELCPWHQQYYSLTLPFYNYFLKPPKYRSYDGPIRHQLRNMSN